MLRKALLEMVLHAQALVKMILERPTLPGIVLMLTKMLLQPLILLKARRPSQRLLVMMPILAIVMTFSIIFTFTDFQLVYAITRGGPVNSTHLLATLAFQRGIAGGELGEGAAIAVSMIPFLVFATLFSYFGLARRKWQQGEAND